MIDTFTPAQQIAAERLAEQGDIPISRVPHSGAAEFHALKYAITPPDSASAFIVKGALKTYLGIDDLTEERIDNPTREDKERRQWFAQNASAYTGLESGAMSYGIGLPFYLERLGEVRQRIGSHEDQKSLLLGALTPDTIKEYELALAMTLPKSRAYVTDIEGVLTPKPNQFVYGSGVQLPFADNSFDTIHTNYLLHAFEAEGVDGLAAYQQLIDEIYRVLKPRGTAILVEGHLPNSLAERGLKPKHATRRLFKHTPSSSDVISWLEKAFGKYDAKFYERFPTFVDRTALYDYIHMTRGADTNIEILYRMGDVENNTNGAIGIQATKPIAIEESPGAISKVPIPLGPIPDPKPVS